MLTLKQEDEIDDSEKNANVGLGRWPSPEIHGGEDGDYHQGESRSRNHLLEDGKYRREDICDTYNAIRSNK